jgi:hypothetical protein
MSRWPSHWVPLLGIVLSMALGLALTGELIFQDWARAHWQDNPDSVAIAKAAQAADWRTALGWWVGPWIESDTFYRPLSSTLMWIEGRLWGYNFVPYTFVSWAMHAGNCALLFLLLYSLCPGPRLQRLAVGVFGALMLNLGHHPPGPDWIRARVAWGVMIYWPVQTDFGCLGFSLLSLLCLDRYLVAAQPRPRLFIAALAFLLAALLFKETALVLLVVAPLVALYRNVPWLKTAVGYFAVCAVIFVMRALVLPAASNPEWMGTYTFYKYLGWIHELSAELLHGGESWEYITVVTLIPLAWLLVRLRVPTLYIVLGCLVWPLVIGGALTGNPALATIPREMKILLRFAAVYGGFFLALLTAGTEPLLIFVVGLFGIAAANVNRIGPHYWYWPVAFWALCNAGAANALVNIIRRRWGSRPHAEQPSTPASPYEKDPAADGVNP